MIRVVCDRCGKQIVDAYCRIKIVPDSLANAEQIIFRGRDVWGSAYNLAQKPILEELNSTQVYCAECVEKLKKFIENGGPDDE